MRKAELKAAFPGKLNMMFDKWQKGLTGNKKGGKTIDFKPHKAEPSKQAPTPAQRDNNTTQSLKTAEKAKKAPQRLNLAQELAKIKGE